MSLKRKLRAKKPPLSLLDKTIYLCICFSFFLLLVFYFIGILKVSEFIAYRTENIIAFNNDLILFTGLPFGLFILIVMLVILNYGWGKQQPIFGNKNFKPKIGSPILKVYPIFSKEFKTEVLYQNKKKLKKVVKVFVITFIICILILLMGLCARTQLDENYTFYTINSFNEVTHSCGIEDFNKLIIKISDIGSYKSGKKYVLTLIFKNDDKSYSFALHDFSKMSKKNALLYMLDLKKHFDNEHYEIDDKKLSSLMIYNNFNKEETALIYELFEV